MQRWLKRGWALLALAAALGVTPAASADLVAPPPAPGKVAKDKDHPGKGADKGADNAAKGPDNAADKGKKGDPAAADAGATDAGAAPGDDADKKAREAKRAAEKAERKAKSKDDKAALRAKVQATLKGQPMSHALREEIKRHARRLARLERAKGVAEDEKDDATVARVSKLTAKENARHDKWMASFDAKAADKGGAK
jgi:hypothetical protein